MTLQLKATPAKGAVQFTTQLTLSKQIRKVIILLLCAFILSLQKYKLKTQYSSYNSVLLKRNLYKFIHNHSFKY